MSCNLICKLGKPLPAKTLNLICQKDGPGVLRSVVPVVCMPTERSWPIIGPTTELSAIIQCCFSSCSCLRHHLRHLALVRRARSPHHRLTNHRTSRPCSRPFNTMQVHKRALRTALPLAARSRAHVGCRAVSRPVRQTGGSTGPSPCGGFACTSPLEWCFSSFCAAAAPFAAA